ncbi:MAG: outer membrane protein multidrug efflux system [Variibacter sp.]|nr:outer membrane protein multidrug efflux system [Variibacter sp.]
MKVRFADRRPKALRMRRIVGEAVEAAKQSGPRRFVAAMFGICLLPLLSGCIVGTEKPDVAIAVPPTYRYAAPAVKSPVPALDWWRGFRSPELTALIEEAQTANLDIAAAIARVEQADAQAKIAGATLFPTVDLNATATRSRPSQATSSTGSTGGGGPSERTLYNVAFRASYEIDFWGKNRATLLAAEQNAVAFRFAREVVTLSTVATVSNTYFLVVSAQDRLRIARENVRSAERILKLIRDRVAAGTASALDAAQQETVLATQRASVPVFEQLIRQNKILLGVLLGQPPEYITVRGGDLARLGIPRVTPGLPSELLCQRPDIRQAEAQLASASANVEAARAAFFPSIQLTGDGGWQSAALKMLFTPASAFYNITSSLTQPIFDGFRLEGQLELQKGRQEELLQLYRRAIVAGFGDVENALIALQQSTIRERLTREAVTSARRAFELSETRLREGTTDLITLLNTQLSLFQAQDAVSQAQLARLQAAVALFQALGGGWAPNILPVACGEEAKEIALPVKG